MKSIQIIKNKIVKILIIAFVITTFGLTTSSCGGSDNPIGAATGCGSWANDIESATSKYFDAATNYANDATSANCKKYKDADLDYVKVYKNISKCIPGASKQVYEQALNDLQTEMNNINCN